MSTPQGIGPVDPKKAVPAQEVKGPGKTGTPPPAQEFSFKGLPTKNPLAGAVTRFLGEVYGRRVDSGKTNPRVANLAAQKLAAGDINFNPGGDSTPIGNV